MKRIIIVLLLFICGQVHSQDYRKVKTLFKHSKKIKNIATCEACFATSSHDKSVIVWNYNGKKIFKHKLNNGKIDALAFIPNSNCLLIAVTEKKGKSERSILKNFDINGNLVKEFIDSDLTQSHVDSVFIQNNSSVQKAQIYSANTFPSLNISTNLNIPQAKYGLSHIERVQNISISPNTELIATIDYFRTIKIWDLKGNITNAFQINNNKKNTKVYFTSDSTLFVTPNMILNINSMGLQTIGNYEAYMSVPLKGKLYCYFDYNELSESEKIVDIMSDDIQTVDSKNKYSIRTSVSNEYFANLGIDGLIRLRDKNGKLITQLGKDRTETITFRGKQVPLYSNICEVGISPNSEYIISGTEKGKITIWKK